jgi:glycosyltransferase involved in cell wall biosynthesis
MVHEQTVVVVLPAYNAEKTLEQTHSEIPHIVDRVILVDDASSDQTVKLARSMNIETFVHEKNLGYGGAQKTCYEKALEIGADIVVMLHPDYQYSPRLVTAIASMIASGHFDIVLGSRILGGEARKGGMPLYKYISNRALTFVQNLVLGVKLSEYHTGFRAFTRRVLETLPLGENSDDFVFDNQMLVQAVYFNFKIGEISCPAKYFEEASSINFTRSLKYGFGVLLTSVQYIMQKTGMIHIPLFDKYGKKLIP